jgi:hypothetical protein
MASGIKYLDMPNLLFQTIVVGQMLTDRKNALLAAKYYSGHQNVLILYDRGLCDNKAYCPRNDWEQILDKNRLSDEKLRFMYHAVFNLVTTAYGAEDAWDKLRGNNPERFEQTVGQARETEDRTQRAWAGHHNLKIFGNDETSWEGKEKRLIDALFSVIGITPPIRMSKRYLVEIPSDLEDFAVRHACVVQSIEQTYLKFGKADVERRVRKIQSGSDVTYYYTEREKTKQGMLSRREYMPKSEREYDRLMAQADPAKNTITKTRYAFTTNNQHLVLDIYPEDKHPQLRGMALLELKEIETAGQELIAPEELTVLQDVTDDNRFAVAALAGI